VEGKEVKKRLKKAYQKFGNVDYYSYVSFVIRDKDMKPPKNLIKAVKGMTPVDFEKYAETHGIETEWMEICLTNPNEGVYEVYLPKYDSTVFSMDGAEIEIL
jgi:hypothetical protein